MQMFHESAVEPEVLAPALVLCIGNDIVGDLHLSQVDNFGAEMRGLGLRNIGWTHDLVGD